MSWGSVARNDYSSSDSETTDFLMYPPINNENMEYMVSPGTHPLSQPTSRENMSTSLGNGINPLISSGNDEVIVMLQQQQAVLEQVFKGQEALKSRQAEMEEKLLSLEVK